MQIILWWSQISGRGKVTPPRKQEETPSRNIRESPKPGITRLPQNWICSDVSSITKCAKSSWNLNSNLMSWSRIGDTYALRDWIIQGKFPCLLIRRSGEADTRLMREKKDNRRTVNTPGIREIRLILTRYQNCYLNKFCNHNLCLIFGIEEKHNINWQWILLLHVHVESFKMSRFVRLFAIINKYSETMKPAMHG